MTTVMNDGKRFKHATTTDSEADNKFCDICCFRGGGGGGGRGVSKT